MANITINNQTTADRTTAPTHEELYLQARSGNEQALWRLCTDYRALFISESQKYATAMADLMDTSDWISIGNILVWDIVSKGNFDPTVSSWGGYLMERNLDVGICGAKVMYASERNKITEEVFTRIYGAQRKEMTGTVDTLRHAFDDFAHGVTGKAADGRIKKFVEPQRKLEELVKQIETAVFTTKNGSAAEFAVMWQMIRYFMLLNPSLSLRMKVDIDDAVNTEGNSRVFVAGPHVSEITKDVLPAIYIDSRKNCVLDDSDYEYFASFKTELKKFREHYRPLFEERKKVERA